MLFPNSRRWNHWLSLVTPYGVAGLLLWGLSSSGIGENLNLLLYDASIQVRKAPSGIDTPIRLIGIDEADIRRYGWPINDKQLTAGLQILRAAGAAAIGLDIYRDKGVDPGSAELRQELKQNPKLVAIFNAAEAIPAPPGTLPEQQAFNDLVLDGDGVLRRDLVHVDGQPPAYLALPLRLWEKAQGNQQLRSTFKNPQLQSRWLTPGSGGYRQLDAAGRQRMLSYLQPGSFPIWNLSTLLDNKIPKADLKGKIILIGSVAPSLRDDFNTPHTRFSAAAQLATMPGVEVHAHRLAALSRLGQGNHYQMDVLPSFTETIALALIAAAGVAIGEGIKALRRSGWILLSGELLLLAIGFGLLLQGIWIGISIPMTTLALITAAGWLRRGAAGQLQRRQIERLLGQTTSPEVAAELWKQRESLLEEGRFPGRELAVTILFADIVGFSQVAEGFQPAETLQWVNTGMEKFVEVIHNNGGMVNKFTGDGFLAVFGVPLAQNPTLTANQALNSAAALQRTLLELNQQLQAENRPVMKLRVGLHSGEVITGSMGSSERMEYAVIGDVVNVSSRLESLHKERQFNFCRVLLSKETLNLLTNPEQWQFNCWGNFPLKGREQSVEVYELTGLNN
ncbi:MAG: adenylate/guanylate cyclase domain-containing protein [Synechococcaceae bacterium WB8_1A_041]|nr:adenylate/guanylate cyclase domain-containing protein [Synechococcaceae bacterium WB6_1A_059]NCY14675.1 adenylate/guanylate cyclase domain-containing protein [Synechococcaceae bacterium WB8_1A_041]